MPGARLNGLSGTTILIVSSEIHIIVANGGCMTRIKVYIALVILIMFTLVMNAHYLGFAPAMFRKGNMYLFGDRNLSKAARGA